jgi:hypothetical protein
MGPGPLGALGAFRHVSFWGVAAWGVGFVDCRSQSEGATKSGTHPAQSRTHPHVIALTGPSTGTDTRQSSHLTASGTHVSRDGFLQCVTVLSLCVALRALFLVSCHRCTYAPHGTVCPVPCDRLTGSGSTGISVCSSWLCVRMRVRPPTHCSPESRDTSVCQWRHSRF